MKHLFHILMLIFFVTTLAFAEDGIISVKSSHNVKITANRLEKALRAKKMTIFARINHSEAAQKIGKKLRSTELIIFGNPKVGTPLMQNNQIVGIDLPQKALIWQDEKGDVWLSYNDPKYIAKRHNINGNDELIKKIEKALSNFAKAATIDK